MEVKNLSREALDALARRMQKGDRKAAAALYDALMPKVYGFLFSRLGKKEAAEDLCQEVFVKLIEKIGSFDPKKGTFTVWFWQVVRRHLIDHYREKQETPFSSFEDVDLENLATMPDVDFHARFTYRALQDAVRTFDDDERELFELRFVAEIPYREIAELTGKHEGALRVAALRVKKKLRRHLDSRP